MKLKKRMCFPLTLAALALAFCLILSACGGNAPQPTAAPAQTAAPQQSGAPTEAPAPSAEPKTVVLAESWSFPSLYPVISPETAVNFGVAYWTMNFYDTLVRYDDNNEIAPCLAESWEVSDDGLVYTFHLRDGVEFSDGTPLTADAVKQSIDAARVNLGSYVGNYGKIGVLIADTQAADDSTFVLTLMNPYYSALNDLSYCLPYAIVNPKAFEGGASAAFHRPSRSGAQGLSSALLRLVGAGFLRLYPGIPRLSPEGNGLRLRGLCKGQGPQLGADPYPACPAQRPAPRGDHVLSVPGLPDRRRSGGGKRIQPQRAGDLSGGLRRRRRLHRRGHLCRDRGRRICRGQPSGRPGQPPALSLDGEGGQPWLRGFSGIPRRSWGWR